MKCNKIHLQFRWTKYYLDNVYGRMKTVFPSFYRSVSREFRPRKTAYFRHEVSSKVNLHLINIDSIKYIYIKFTDKPMIKKTKAQNQNDLRLTNHFTFQFNQMKIYFKKRKTTTLNAIDVIRSNVYLSNVKVIQKIKFKLRSLLSTLKLVQMLIKCTLEEFSILLNSVHRKQCARIDTNLSHIHELDAKYLLRSVQKFDFNIKLSVDRYEVSLTSWRFLQNAAVCIVLLRHLPSY